jgi:ferritin-like metal-binding protein YciE
LRQTSEQVSRLEQIFEQLDEKPSGRKCLGMEGPVKEGAETMKEDYVDEVKDAAIIGAAQRGRALRDRRYGTVRTLAELLGENDHAWLLEQTLDEEKQADQKLTELSQEINRQAAQAAERTSTAAQDPRKLHNSGGMEGFWKSPSTFLDAVRSRCRKMKEFATGVRNSPSIYFL